MSDTFGFTLDDQTFGPLNFAGGARGFGFNPFMRI
ncbi:hypothetical protein RAHE111665_15890 [Rariglobus hedericola]